MAWGGKREVSEVINTLHPLLEFTLQYNHSQIHYLDVTVTKQDGVLNNDIYRKDTDKNNLLLHSQFHPPNTKKGLPYS